MFVVAVTDPVMLQEHAIVMEIKQMNVECVTVKVYQKDTVAVMVSKRIVMDYAVVVLV